MLSVILNKFICPGCATETQLLIQQPLFVTCPSCAGTYNLDTNNNATKTRLQKRNLLPLNTITLGAKGKYQDKDFEIIGQIRSINSTSISNEWLMKFESAKEMWLIENGLNYFVFDSNPIEIPGNQIRDKKVGTKITIDKKEYTIIDLSKQIEFQMDGQMPENCFNDQSYFKYEGIDIDTNSLISICIFDKVTIEAYKGVAVELTDLKLSTLTEFKNWL